MQLCAPAALAQDVTESSLRSAFIHNFVKFTVWPTDVLAPGAPLMACVLGDAAFVGVLANYVKGNPVDGHAIVVSGIALGGMRSCHLLWVSGVTAQAASQAVSTLAGAPILTISDVDHNLDGVLAVAILDLSTGQKYFLRADEVLPTASSIKIAILAELYRQAQQSKLKLTDLYTLQQSDLVGGSGISETLTPGTTRLTIRDVAALMISVSDNSATNIIIDRVGMENVNALLNSLGLTHTRLRRKMMDLKAAGEGRENVASPRELMLLLENLYRGKVLNKQFTEDFFKLLSVHKESYIPRELPEDLRVANKPGELEGVRNDSGIVFTGSRPFVISVMTTYLRRERDGGDAIVRISTAAYRMFDRLSRASEYGRVISPHDTGNP
jgi:beta-lactamase class A